MLFKLNIGKICGMFFKSVYLNISRNWIIYICSICLYWGVFGIVYCLWWIIGIRVCVVFNEIGWCYLEFMVGMIRCRIRI